MAPTPQEIFQDRIIAYSLNVVMGGTFIACSNRARASFVLVPHFRQAIKSNVYKAWYSDPDLVVLRFIKEIRQREDPGYF
jgi:hypothetical protein